MRIGRPRRVWEVQPVSLPIPEVLPDPTPEPVPEPVPEPAPEPIEPLPERVEPDQDVAGSAERPLRTRPAG